MSMQNAEFTARLARINAGTGNTRHTMFVGMDESFNVSEKALARVLKPQTPQALDEAVGVSSMMMAVVAGFVAYAGALYLRFFLLGVSADGGFTDVALLANGLCAVAVGILIGQMLRLTGIWHLTAQTLGIFLGLCLFHNLVHQAPEAFEMIFSPDWTAQVLARTEPMSVQFRGFSLTF